MGVRFRKSIKSGPFRINLSKSGVGWSVGGKGFRYTKTATGRTRRTYSIPGTGISYVTEKGNSKQTKSAQPRYIQTVAGTKVNMLHYPNSSSDSELYTDITNRVNKSLEWNRICNLLFLLSFLIFFNFFFVFVPVLLLVAKFFIYYFTSTQLEFNLSEEQKKIHDNNIKAWHSLDNNKTIRLVLSSTYTENNKNNAGVSNNYQRDYMRIDFSLPWFLKSNIPLVQLKLKGGKVFIMPQAIMVIVNNQVFINEGTIHIDSDDAQFTEGDATPLPEDIQIVGYTYLHVKKNGDPDLRYNDNPRFPICLYKQINFSTDFGLNFVALFPNISATERFLSGYSDEVNAETSTLSIDKVKDKNGIINQYFKAVWIPLLILGIIFLFKFVDTAGKGDLMPSSASQIYQREDYPDPVQRFEIVGNQFLKQQSNIEVELVSSSDDSYKYKIGSSDNYSIELYAPDKSILMITLTIKNEKPTDEIIDNLLQMIVYVIDVDSQDSDIKEISENWRKMEQSMFEAYKNNKVSYYKDFNSFDDLGNEYSIYRAMTAKY